MIIPTEPIGSIPRPAALLEGLALFKTGQLSKRKLDSLHERALRDTIQRFEATGSPVISDGEQAKPSALTYPIDGLANLAEGGFSLTYRDGHQRQLPRLRAGPFRYRFYADRYLQKAHRYATRPVKQAVVAPSALSLLYPQAGIPAYPGETYLADLIGEAEKDIRRCLVKGAHVVQIDFAEARLALTLDPSRQLLRSFIALNTRLLERFTPAEQARIGIHSCAGHDRQARLAGEVDLAALLPDLLQMPAGCFYLQLAGVPNRDEVLRLIATHARPQQRIFIGVIDPLDPRIETAATVRDRLLEAAEHLAPERLGTTDDCGFAPFADDGSTARDVAFAKIAARVEGTALAAGQLDG